MVMWLRVRVSPPEPLEWVGQRVYLPSDLRYYVTMVRRLWP
jgi:hypothetical protein